MADTKRDKTGKTSFSTPLIILVVLVLLISFFAQGMIISAQISKNVKFTQTENFTIITQSLTDFIERELISNERLLNAFADTISHEVAMNGGELEFTMNNHDIIMDLYNSSSYFESSFLIDLDGKVLDSSYSADLIGVDLSEREYYNAVVNLGKDTYTAKEAVISKATGNLTVVHAAAIELDGELIGLLAVSLDLTSFGNAFILTRTIGNTGYPYVLDKDGMVLVHPSESLLFTQSQDVDPFFQTVVDSRERVQNISYKLSGSPKQGVFVRMPKTDWIVCLAINDEEAFVAIFMLRIMLISTSLFLLILISLILFLYIRKKLVVNLGNIEQILFRASEGDLTQRGEVKGNDEIAGMTGYFNTFLDSLYNFFMNLKINLSDLDEVGQDLSANMEETAAALHEIRTNVDNSQIHIDQQEKSVAETVSVVQDIIKNIQDLDKNIGLQDSNIQQGSSAIEEMIAQIRNVSSSTEEAERIMDILSKSSQLGKENLNNVSEMITSIAEKSKKLEEANTLIAGIAARTNLLAMNAAIEAAHAGDAGRGFAVVADEIRKLAEQSTKQSGEVKQTISDISHSFDQIVVESKSTNSSFEEILSNMASMGRITGEIKSSMEEQVAGSTQVLQSLEEMKSAGMDVMRGSKEMNEGNNRILQTVQSLTQISSEVSMAMREIGNGMDEINKSVLNVSDIAQKNKTSINLVKTDASQYKTDKEEVPEASAGKKE